MQVIVFEQNGSGTAKISGINQYGKDITISKRYSINEKFPDFVDNPQDYISSDFSADLVLDFLKHPDLSHYLISLCRNKKIPVIASGKKKVEGAYTPFTCCGLGKHERLSEYGKQFGVPEFRVELQGNKISLIEVLRGAPCGATWDVLARVIGKDVDECLSFLPREIQYLCVADPSAFDPISGKSPLHFAGHVHRAALEKAIDLARKYD